MGRFITRDSYNGTVRDPLSQNRYIYAEDNPLRYVDPTGHDACHASPDVCYGGNQDSSTTTKLDLQDWLINDFLPSQFGDISIGVVGVLSALLGPVAIALFGGESHIFAVAALLVAGSIGQNLEKFASDVSSGNVGHLAIDLGNVAYTVARGMLNDLSAPTLIELAVGEGLWTFGTAGMGNLVDWTGAAIAGGVFAASLSAQAAYGYQSYLLS